MATQYWLVKSEPSTYSWETFVSEGWCHWDGVRNYQARNNMKEMKVGDLVLYYHSVKKRDIVGVARVTREFYQDPTTEDERWVVVNLEPVKALDNHVNLKQVKADDVLKETALVKQSRLSVMPLTESAFNRVLELAETSLEPQPVAEAPTTKEEPMAKKTEAKAKSKKPASKSKSASKAKAKPKAAAKSSAKPKTASKSDTKAGAKKKSAAKTSEKKPAKKSASSSKTKKPAKDKKSTKAAKPAAAKKPKKDESAKKSSKKSTKAAGAKKSEGKSKKTASKKSSSTGKAAKKSSKKSSKNKS